MEKISLELAIETLLQNIEVLNEYENRSLLDSLGFVLIEDIISPLNSPPFNRSPLDGFTMNCLHTVGASKDNPVIFKVKSEIFAGSYV
ncbi:MAG: hypothetical protein ACRCZI_11590, partial [Cetobacterium sp.]